MIQKTKRSIQWIVENKTFFLPKKKKYAGVHLIVDFWHGKLIEDPKELKAILLESVKRAGGTALETVIYKFLPQGITGVVLLAESHIAIHTWPEFDYTAIDIFTCGDKARPLRSLEYLKEQLNPEKIEIKELKRGKLLV